CEACGRLAESTHGAEIFNVARGREVTILDLAHLIIALTNSESPIEHVDSLPKRDDFEVERRIVSSDKLEQFIGFRPLRELEDGLRELVSTPRSPAGPPP